MEDLNGDGHVELLRALPDQLICQNLKGKTIWDATDLVRPSVDDVRDWRGGGPRGLRVRCDTGVRLEDYLVNGATGARTLLYVRQDAFGGYERSGHILPGVPGQQLCIWWDGENPEDRNVGGGNMYGHGYLWSFENGPDRPTLRFRTQAHGVVYAGQHLFADMDGDGRDEFVLISHEQVWLFDPQTGQQKAYYYWTPQIRTYAAQVAALPLRRGELPSLLMVNYMIPGVQVVKQDGKSAERFWKQVIGPREDQYQNTIKVAPGAPDPFLDLNGDGIWEIVTKITNEHGDGATALVIFDSLTGQRLFEQPGLSVVTADDLDGRGAPEILLKENQKLTIADWDGKAFVPRWSGEGVEPILADTPPEGHLNRSNTVGYNAPLRRVRYEGREAFALRFPDAGLVACRLEKGGALQQVHPIASLAEVDPEAAKPPLDAYTWDGETLVSQEGGKEVWRFEVPQQRTYLAPPPIVGRLGGGVRIITRTAEGTLISLDGQGEDRRELLPNAPANPPGTNMLSYTTMESPLLSDIDGDGRDELISTAQVDGKPCVVILNADGSVRRTIEPIADATEVNLGQTGRLGKGRGRWLVVRYTRRFQPEMAVAYDAVTGEKLWGRDSYTNQPTPYKFVLWLPTVVLDYDGDGADDMLCYSANHYGIISVKDGRDLVLPMAITQAFPGHWPAYNTPVIAHFTEASQPQLFLSRAYSMVGGTDLEGRPIWHYGFRRSETPNRHGAVLDLDGDGQDEVIVAQRDGLLRACSGVPLDEKCPTCPPDAPLGPANHSGRQRWTCPLAPNVSDFAAADLDGDGRFEALCGAEDGRLYAIKEIDGKCAALWNLKLSDQAVGSPIVADLDGTGKPAILVPTADGRLHCLGTGEMTPASVLAR